jgi:hypothetical protein
MKGLKARRGRQPAREKTEYRMAGLPEENLFFFQDKKRRANVQF